MNWAFGWMCVFFVFSGFVNVVLIPVFFLF